MKTPLNAQSMQDRSFRPDRDQQDRHRTIQHSCPFLFLRSNLRSQAQSSAAVHHALSFPFCNLSASSSLPSKLPSILKNPFPLPLPSNLPSKSLILTSTLLPLSALPSPSITQHPPSSLNLPSQPFLYRAAVVVAVLLSTCQDHVEGRCAARTLTGKVLR